MVAATLVLFENQEKYYLGKNDDNLHLRYPWKKKYIEKQLGIHLVLWDRKVKAYHKHIVKTVENVEL